MIDSSSYRIRRNFWRGFQHDLEFAGRDRSHLYAVAADYLMAVQFFSNAEWAFEKTRKHVRTHYAVYCCLIILSAIWYLIGNFLCPPLLRETHYHAHDSFGQNQILVVMRGTNVMEVQVSDKEGNRQLLLTPENQWEMSVNHSQFIEDGRKRRAKARIIPRLRSSPYLFVQTIRFCRRNPYIM